MNNMPNELDKIKVDMNKCFDIFTILEDFNYRFTNEEMDKVIIILFKIDF